MFMVVRFLSFCPRPAQASPVYYDTFFAFAQCLMKKVTAYS